MDEVTWLDVCALEDIPADGVSGLPVKAGRKDVALFRVADTVYAVHDYCPHQGAPLHNGTTRTTTLICADHDWEFSLEDGTCDQGEECNIMTWHVQVKDGRVLISKLPKL